MKNNRRNRSFDTVEEVIKIYEQLGKIMYEATLSGDYRANNKVGKKLVNIFKLFEKDEDFGKKCIDKLLESECVVVRTKAAAYCLALRYNDEYAISLLNDIANNDDNGIFGFNAKMLLEVWEKKGELKIYQ